MANFSTTLQPKKHDDYMTPKYVWEHIQHLIPKDKVIWEPFYGDGQSGNHLKDLGFEVIHKHIDFFENNLGDIIISNPPFSKSKEVLSRLRQLDKPFIIILPTQKLNTCYMRENYKNTELQIIIPRKRIQFIKIIDGQPVEGYKNQCSFDCYYYCYKMNFPRDIMWLS
jgi:hypothetical protein